MKCANSILLAGLLKVILTADFVSFSLASSRNFQRFRTLLMTDDLSNPNVVRNGFSRPLENVEVANIPPINQISPDLSSGTGIAESGFTNTGVKELQPPSAPIIVENAERAPPPKILPPLETYELLTGLLAPIPVLPLTESTLRPPPKKLRLVVTSTTPDVFQAPQVVPVIPDIENQKEAPAMEPAADILGDEVVNEAVKPVSDIIASDTFNEQEDTTRRQIFKLRMVTPGSNLASFLDTGDVAGGFINPTGNKLGAQPARESLTRFLNRLLGGLSNSRNPAGAESLPQQPSKLLQGLLQGLIGAL